MTSRIYAVRDGTDDVRLIEATSAARAIHVAVTARYSATVAKPMEIADLMERGVKVEKIADPVPFAQQA